MFFYTNVNRYGSNILFRGYEDGRRIKRKIPFKPTLYVKSNDTSTKYTSLDGISVNEIPFESMSDAKEFAKKYESVDNFTVYGNTNFVAQYIAKEFLNEIEYRKEWVRVANIDIETPSDIGFPEPKDAKVPVVSITLRDSVTQVYNVWGLGDYDTEKRERQDCTVHYVKCASEEDLLKGFLSYWSNEFTCPDIVTSWNGRSFDIPYLVNRINKILGEEYVKKLSPWGMVEERQVSIMKNMVQVYDLVGIAQLDYLDLFKKFAYSYGPQENYRLDTIASVVLGEQKLNYDEYGSLTKLYNENFQMFTEYNVRDVWLVDRIDDKTALIELCLTMAYKAGVNYSDTLGTTAIWDQLVHRTLLREDVVIPPNKNSFKSDYVGGYVKDPQVGLHEWVVSFDINSLYPSIIMQWNMSPETIKRGMIDSKVTIDLLLDGFESNRAKFYNASVTANGCLFDNATQGVFPKIVEGMYEDRVSIKKLMLASKREYELCDKSNKDELYRIERDITHYNNQQTAIKIFLNSLYGAMGSAYFRYFAMEIAEGITTTGQFIIKYAEKQLNEYINSILKTSEDYVIGVDTDSCYLKLDALVKKVLPNGTQTQIVNFLDKVCAKIEDDVFGPKFHDIYVQTNCFKEKITMKRESIASRAIWTAKKRYILNVLDNEGVRYSEPKLKMMGIEAVKSSTPMPCRVAFKKLFHIIMNKTEEETQAFVVNFRSEFDSMAPEAKAFPRSVSDVEKFANSKTIYVKGTPMNARASLLYNNLLKQYGIENHYPIIRNGEKIKYIYLNPRNPTRENIIGFVNTLPKEFGLEKYIDNDTQFDKAFLTPANLILNAIGWSAEQKSTLDDFFK